MARNDVRRAALADAGIRILAQEGSRGLTHRAVDEVAGTPRGTASNYFPNRERLISALVDRIGERLAPDPGAVTSSGRTPNGREAFRDALRDVIRRLDEDPHIPLALFELRLEAARRPAVAEALGAWRQREFDKDVAFNADAGLPGGPTEIALFHFAVDGLMLDRLTVPLDTGLSTDEVLEEFVHRLLR